MRHDARTYCETGPRRPKRPYGWSCLTCPAKRSGFATGASAKAAAIKHNGGAYNEQEGWKTYV